MNNRRCRDFLRSHGIDPDELIKAIRKQRGFSASESTLTAFRAGILPKGDKEANLTVQQINARYRVVAVTGMYRDRTRYNVYFGNGMGNPTMTVMHEALHSLTRLNDFDLGVKLGLIHEHNKGAYVSGRQDASADIAGYLAENGCYKL